MDVNKLSEVLRAALQQELAPLREELGYLRALLEQQRSAREGEPIVPPAAAIPASEARVSDAQDAAAPGSPGSPATEAAGTPAEALQPEHATAGSGAAARGSPEASAGRSSRIEAQRVLLRQLLADYPDDAAAVYYAFDRQYRCAPDHLDRLARGGDLRTAWATANRACIRTLAERFHGGLHMVADLLGRDSDSLARLIDSIGIGPQLESIRDRERQRIHNASLGHRLAQVLCREKLLRDLDILEEVDERTRIEVRERCAALAGECPEPQSVLPRLREEFGLDAEGLVRLERRYDLDRFIADLYQQPFDDRKAASARPGPGQPSREGRRPLEDAEIESRILRMLLSKGKVGAAHTHIGHLIRTVPRHERGRARDIVNRLVSAGCLVLKTTDNSAEPHVSIAIGAVPQVEQLIAPPSH